MEQAAKNYGAGCPKQFEDISGSYVLLHPVTDQDLNWDIFVIMETTCKTCEGTQQGSIRLKIWHFSYPHCSSLYYDVLCCIQIVDQVLRLSPSSRWFNSPFFGWLTPHSFVNFPLFCGFRFVDQILVFACFCFLSNPASIMLNPNCIFPSQLLLVTPDSR